MKQSVLTGQVSAVGLLLVAASSFYSRVFNGSGWIVPVLLGALFSALLGYLLTRTSLNSVLRGISLASIGALFVTLTVLLPGTNFGGFGELFDAFYGSTIDGWRNALAVTLPIDTSLPEPLGFAAALAWIAGSVTGSALGRPKGTVGLIVPGIALAGLSLPLAAPNGFASFAFIAGLVAAVLLVALVRSVPHSNVEDGRKQVNEFVDERVLTERLTSGGPVLVVLAVLMPLLAGVLPFGNDEPFDPRVLREPEQVTSRAPNPLAEMKALRESAVPAFDLELPAAPAAEFFDRVTLVALDQYDGVTWSTDATYSATSSDIEGVETAFDTLEVTQNFELLDTESPWIPTGGGVIRINHNDAWYDDATGTFLDQSDGQITNYSIVSQVVAPTTEQLRQASLDLSDLRYTNAGIEIPSDSPITTLTTRLEGPTTYDQLTALESFLRDEIVLVGEAASGTALGRIDEFLIDGEGYRDQFVTAFVLAARQQGIPARVAIGYRITTVDEDSNEVFLESITTEEYDAWPEVRFEDIGWVAFDPVPAVTGDAGGVEDNATEVPEGQPAPAGPTPTESDPTEDDNLDEEPETVSATVRVLIVSGLFLLFFPILLVLFIIGLKRLRRRRRENLIDPTERVLAGWQESKERLVEAGVQISPDMTVKEIVTMSRKELGLHAAAPLSVLAPQVTKTIYADGKPGPAAADLVWREVDEFDRQLGESRSLGQNVKAKVNPKPLLEKV